MNVKMVSNPHRMMVEITIRSLGAENMVVVPTNDNNDEMATRKVRL